MSRLRNDRHELFALALAAGQAPGDAYLSAGFLPSTPRGAKISGARLACRQSIMNRLAEMRAEAAMQAIPPAETIEQEIEQQLDDRSFVRERLRWIIDVSLGRIKRASIPVAEAKIALRGLDQLAKASGMYSIGWDATPPVEPLAPVSGAGELRSVEFRERIIRLGVEPAVADRLADAARRLTSGGGGGSPE